MFYFLFLGNHLLPTMGYCEVEEASKDQLTVHHNSYVFLCEISTNILYQYVMVVLWFLFIISITISILGFISALLGYLPNILCYNRNSPKKTISRVLTLRENEYLDFIKKKDMVMYGDVLRKLKQQRSDLQGKIVDNFETSNGFVWYLFDYHSFSLYTALTVDNLFKDIHTSREGNKTITCHRQYNKTKEKVHCEEGWRGIIARSTSILAFLFLIFWNDDNVWTT